MSFTELLILAVIGLVVLGPEELPVMARKLAKFINEISKVKNDLLGPLTEVHDSTKSFLDETREMMSKDLSELVNLRNQLDQEISRRQNSATVNAETEKAKLDAVASESSTNATESESEAEPESQPLGTPQMASPDHTVPRPVDETMIQKPTEDKTSEKASNGKP